MSDDSVALSDMETVVLGVVWRDGPCSAYHVRKEFVDSPASFWSGSQGAIYPLLRKLAKEGLVSSAADPSSKRNTKLLTITSKGKQQVSEWYEPGKIGDSVLREFDALRTRVFFLSFLNARQKRKFIEHVEFELKNQEKRTLERIKVEEDEINVLALRGLLACNKARQKWVEMLKEKLLRAQ